MGRKGIAALMLAGVLVGFAPFASMLRAAAHESDQETVAVDSIVQGVVTQKFTSTDPDTYTIAVDGWPYEVPPEIYYRVQVGTAVQFDGTNWTIVGGAHEEDGH
jgi:hypothetical protein